jgi:hypothetical protein
VLINKSIKDMGRRTKNWKQKKHEEKVFEGRNWVAKHDKNKGGSHKSKKDYDRKSLVQKLKNYIKGL